MSFTRHALIRMQQRGIRPEVVEDPMGIELQTLVEYSSLLLAALLWAWSGV